MKGFYMHDLDELRQRWSEAWGLPINEKISRPMLERSLEYKLNVESLMPVDVRQRLDGLVADYKRNKRASNSAARSLKVGTKLVRNWQGVDHIVTVIDSGFEYHNQQYKSLSKIANEITGSRWDGWLFFGLCR
jgi:hypothetical protein